MPCDIRVHLEQKLADSLSAGFAQRFLVNEKIVSQVGLLHDGVVYYCK